MIEQTNELKDEEIIIKDEEEIIFEAMDSEECDDDNVALFSPTNDEREVMRILPIHTTSSFEKIEFVSAKIKQYGGKAESHIKNTAKEISDNLLSPFLSSEEEEEGSWLQGELLNLYFHRLSTKYDHKKISRIMTGIDLNFYVKSVSSTGCFQGERANLKKANIIFWPIHAGNHWYLLIIQKEGKTFDIRCLDGFNMTQKQNEFLSLGINLVKSLFDNSSDLIVSYQDTYIPRQNNANDCGVVVCYFAEKVCQGKNLSDYHELYASGKECDFSQFRLNIADEITSLSEASFCAVLSQKLQRNNTKGPSSTSVCIDLTKENTSKMNYTR